MFNPQYSHGRRESILQIPSDPYIPAYTIDKSIKKWWAGEAAQQLRALLLSEEPTPVGGSQPSVTLISRDLTPCSDLLRIRHTCNVQIYMQTKHAHKII